MLNSTFGLNKDYLKFIDKENSFQNENEDSYILIFVSGAKEVFKKTGIKKAVINYIELHKENLELSIQKTENVSNQSERLQATNKEEIDKNVSNQSQIFQADKNNNALEVFNSIPVERLKRLFTLENIDFLEKFIETQRVAVITGEPVIPDYYRKLSNNKSVSIRMNEDIYNRLKKHSIDIGETVATITNYLFDMYLKEIKK